MTVKGVWRGRKKKGGGSSEINTSTVSPCSGGGNDIQLDLTFISRYSWKG